jgi:20S proteasome subunit beta 7
VDLRGTTWQSDSIATGFGSYLAQPLLRKALDQHGENMSEEQAATLLDDCMRVLFYRDARSLNRVCRWDDDDYQEEDGYDFKNN